MANSQDKKFQTNQKYNRCFSENFRREKVKELVSGRLKVTELCEMYDLSRTTVYKWLYLYSQVEKGVKTVVQMDSEATKTKSYLQRIADLERAVGQKQLEIEYLNVCLSLASKEAGYDLKKKYEPQRWNTSETAPSKNEAK